MSGQMILAASRDRAASGRTIAGMFAAGLFSVGALIVQLGRMDVPMAVPPVEQPQVTPHGGDHRAVFGSDEYRGCYVAGRVNGSRFGRMLLDTGASGQLILGSNMAAQAGFDPSTLAYNYRYGSANGDGREAHVTVRELRLLDDRVVLRGVAARISLARQSEPLVGFEILRELNFRLAGRNCELSW